jgi:hypothetical protein
MINFLFKPAITSVEEGADFSDDADLTDEGLDLTEAFELLFTL